MLTGKALMYRIIGRRCLYRTNSWEIRRIQWISPPDLREGLFFTSRRRLFYDKIATWRVGGAVTQRSAKPFRPVQLWYAPPRLFRSVARVAELVYAADLKSASFTGLWVRVSSRAPRHQNRPAGLFWWWYCYAICYNLRSRLATRTPTLE